VRDWLYVDDAVDAVLRAAGERADGRRLNVGSGRGVSVAALHEAVCAVAGRPGLVPERAPAIPGELPSLVLEVGAARRALGWEPFTPLEKGLAARPRGRRRLDAPESTTRGPRDGDRASAVRVRRWGDGRGWPCSSCGRGACGPSWPRVLQGLSVGPVRSVLTPADSLAHTQT
jgi:hypothetical protein